MMSELHPVPCGSCDVWKKIASTDILVTNGQACLQSQTVPVIVQKTKDGLGIDEIDTSVLDQLQVIICKNAVKKESHAAIAGLSAALLGAGLNISFITENRELAAQARKVGHIARRLLFSGVARPLAWCLDKIQEALEEFLIKSKMNIKELMPDISVSRVQDWKEAPFYVRIPFSTLSSIQFLIGRSGALAKERAALEMQHIENCLVKATRGLDEIDLSLATPAALIHCMQKRDQAWSLLLEAQKAYSCIKHEAQLYVEKKDLFSVLNRKGALGEKLRNLQVKYIDVKIKEWIYSEECEKALGSIQAIYSGKGAVDDEACVTQVIELCKDCMDVENVCLVKPFSGLSSRQQELYTEFVGYVLKTAEQVIAGKRNACFKVPEEPQTIDEGHRTEFGKNVNVLNGLFDDCQGLMNVALSAQDTFMTGIESFVKELRNLAFCDPNTPNDCEAAVLRLEFRRRYLLESVFFEEQASIIFQKVHVFLASKDFGEFFNTQGVSRTDLDGAISQRKEAIGFFDLLRKLRLILKIPESSETALVERLKTDIGSLQQGGSLLRDNRLPSAEETQLVLDVKKTDEALTRCLNKKSYSELAAILEQEEKRKKISINHVGVQLQYMSAQDLLEPKLQQAKLLIEEKVSEILSGISWDDFENILSTATPASTQEAKELLKKLLFVKRFGSIHRKNGLDPLLKTMFQEAMRRVGDLDTQVY